MVYGMRYNEGGERTKIRKDFKAMTSHLENVPNTKQLNRATDIIRTSY